MRNYTATGFAKRRVPQALWQELSNFWNSNRHQIDVVDEWDGLITPYHNHWQASTTFLNIHNQSYSGGGTDLAARITDVVRQLAEVWTGQVLTGTSVYGIRIYHNNSILAPHVDRIPLVTSAIINIDQDVNEDWYLELYDHQGVAHNITMEPGELLLYESHSVIHGRPFPLNGRYYANLFVHFEVLGDLTANTLPPSGGLPPYLLEGSSWEPEFWKDFPQGWQALESIKELVVAGDLRTLRYIVQHRPEATHMVLDGKNGYAVIHEAVWNLHFDIVQFLIDEVGIDVDSPFYVPYPLHLLDLAYSRIEDKKHPIFNFLLSRGATLSPVTLKRLGKSS
jgi:prolyl 4-hydroxylase